MLKLVESEIYSPSGLVEPKKSIFQKIDEEESINSSVPQSAPPKSNTNFAFKIDLKEVSPLKLSPEK
jgi:hypothetical protein